MFWRTGVVMLVLCVMASFAMAAAPPNVSVTSNKIAVKMGETASLTVAGGSTKWTYTWSVQRGSIVPKGKQARFTPANSLDPGPDVVTVVIRVDSSTTITRTITLFVYKQFVILKADDFARRAVYPPPYSDSWNTFFNYISTQRIKASVGIIADHLDPAYYNAYLLTEFLDYAQNWYDTGLIEYFNHGYDHSGNGQTTAEFYGPLLADQQSHMNLAQSLFKSQLGLTSSAFGAPYNLVDANGVTVLNSHPEIKVVFFVPASGTTKMVLPHWNGDIEPQTAVPNFDYFLHSDSSHLLYTGYKSSASIVVLQFHPGYDTFGANFSQFTQIIDYLRAQKVTFIRPTEYFNLIKNGTLPTP